MNFLLIENPPKVMQSENAHIHILSRNTMRFCFLFLREFVQSFKRNFMLGRKISPFKFWVHWAHNLGFAALKERRDFYVRFVFIHHLLLLTKWPFFACKIFQYNCTLLSVPLTLQRNMQYLTSIRLLFFSSHGLPFTFIVMGTENVLLTAKP